MSLPCDGDFHFCQVDEQGYTSGMVIPFANGVHVNLFPEDFASPSPRLRAYVYHKDQTNLHFRNDAPSNREMYGADVLKLLSWAAALDSSTPPPPKKEWPESVLDETGAFCEYCGMRYWEG